MSDIAKKVAATVISAGILANIAFAWDVSQRLARIEARLSITVAAR